MSLSTTSNNCLRLFFKELSFIALIPLMIIDLFFQVCCGLCQGLIIGLRDAKSHLVFYLDQLKDE